MEYAKWKSFRQSEDSRYVALTLPHILMRLPYGKETVPVEDPATGEVIATVADALDQLRSELQEIERILRELVSEIAQLLLAPVWGRVSDRIGRKRVFLAGLALACLVPLAVVVRVALADWISALIILLWP